MDMFGRVIHVALSAPISNQEPLAPLISEAHLGHVTLSEFNKSFRLLSEQVRLIGILGIGKLATVTKFQLLGQEFFKCSGHAQRARSQDRGRATLRVGSAKRSSCCLRTFP